MENKFYSGFAAIIGRPNVGKSTLINHLCGEKIAIVSNKPQTTRNQIKGILHGEDYQAVLIDTPGLHSPKSKLGKFMVKSAESAFDEVDIILFLTEASDKSAEKFARESTKFALCKSSRWPLIA